MGKYLALLRKPEASAPVGSCPARPTGAAAPAAHRQAWTSDVLPSRRLLIAPEVRSKIQAIEVDARAKGWPPELLWNSGFWDCPRGLASCLRVDDEIAEVTADAIVILRTKRDLLRFARNDA